MNKIKEARIERGLTQHQFAELTGVPFRTIQNWEGGKHACPDYVERLILDDLDRGDKPDYQTILKEMLETLESDVKHLETDEARTYVTRVITDIRYALDV